MNMMKIEEVVGDVILIILENYEPLKKIGIESDKIFARVKGYDEHGIWIYQPKFNIPKINSTKKNETQKIEASILIPWGFIVSIAHFPGAEGFDFPSPFDSQIGFK
ncbi:MAG: hypothetical protein ACJZ19_03185 [Candidatus Neomarinimicrobiota bacterium]|tara:strand:- start:250 stop:567 length:318 start_codon:yes stop_codon:yes gene_type:complete